MTTPTLNLGRIVPNLPVAVPYYANLGDPMYDVRAGAVQPIGNTIVDYTPVAEFVDVVLSVTGLLTTSAAVGNRTVILRAQSLRVGTLWQVSSPQVQTAGQQIYYTFAWGVATTVASSISVTLPLFPIVLPPIDVIRISASGADVNDVWTIVPQFSVLRFLTDAIQVELEASSAQPPLSPVIG